MSKRNREKRVFKARIRQVPNKPEIWIPEHAVSHDLQFLEKLYPGENEGAISSLIERGYLSVRINPTNGQREFRYNRANFEAALNRLPERSNHHIKIYEDTAEICHYDSKLTMLLSWIMQQNDNEGTDDAIPWITRTHEQLQKETMDECEPLAEQLSRLEEMHFIEITENGPEQYRYRLNVAVVQAALDALSESEEADS